MRQHKDILCDEPMEWSLQTDGCIGIRYMSGAWLLYDVAVSCGFRPLAMKVPLDRIVHRVVTKFAGLSAAPRASDLDRRLVELDLKTFPILLPVEHGLL